MADVSINYKGAKIAELTETGNKTLKTSGKYCEGDIEVNYTPNSRTYELTLAKASSWVLLTTLDSDVLEHINDNTLTVSFELIGEHEYVFYSIPLAIVKNTRIALQDEYAVYGMMSRLNSTTSAGSYQVYYPANKSDTSISLGNGQFRISDNKYYIRPMDGFVCGTYRLTFTW